MMLSGSGTGPACARLTARYHQFFRSFETGHLVAVIYALRIIVSDPNFLRYHQFLSTRKTEDFIA
jgi:hypothetical protein